MDLLIFILTVSAAIAQDGKKDKKQKTRLSELLWKNEYDKRDPPSIDRPTKVGLGLYVNNIYSISEENMDFSLSFYLRQAWRDPRLAFQPIDDVKKIKLEEGEWNDIWIPDTFFRNAKRADFHSVSIPNTLMRLNNSGHIWYVTKISATLSCPMNLAKYPLDTQICPIMFESFGYTMDALYYAWNDDPFEVDPSVQLPQFTLQNHNLHDCSQNYTAGSFTCLEIRMVLKRDLGYFLIQVFTPTILVVIISWISFWLNPDAVVARILIGLLTLISITNQSSAAKSSLGRVSYVTALDVWMFGCLFFIFASVVEYALVNLIARQRSTSSSNNERSVKIKDNTGRDKAEILDKMSRIVFPLSFLIFTLMWWVLYTVL